MNAYSAVEQRVVDQLRLFLGEEAPAVYERCGRSLLQLSSVARESAHPTYRLLAAGLNLATEALAEPMRSAPVFESPSRVKDYLKLHFAGQGHESFVVLYLDTQLHLIALQELFRGTLAHTSVHPREVLRESLSHGAAAIILSHNHPSGLAEPSGADELLTRTLVEALKYIDVRVIDHIIVAGNNTCSMAERGLV